MAGGIDWFRWHHGSVTDPKFQLVAKKAGVRLGDVMVVWAFILECASASAERGSFGEPDFDTLDFLLGADPGAAERIFDSMMQRALIHATPCNESATLHATESVAYRVARWDVRQPKRERDTGQTVGDATERALPKSSTERSRHRRNRLAGGESMQRHATPCNASNDQATPREEKRREEEKETSSLSAAPARPEPAALALVEQPKPKTVPDCPHAEILALWAHVLPALPQHLPEHWRGARADHLRARWRETAVLKAWESKAEGLAFFRKLFGYVGASAFLTGRAPPRDQKRPFVIELEWLVNPTNWAKVIEGKYHQEAA